VTVDGVAERVDRERLTLWVVAVLLVVVLAFVAWTYVGTFVFGLFVYYATRPVMDRVSEAVPSRSLAAAVALLVFVVPSLLLFAYTLAVALGELLAFASADRVGAAVAVLEPYLPVSLVAGGVEAFVSAVVADPSQLEQLTTSETLGGVVDATLGSLGLLGNAGLHAFVVLVLSFYLLRDDYRIARWARTTFVREGSVVEGYFAVVDEDLRSIYFGNIVNAAFTGLLAAVVFNLLNLLAPAGVTIPQPTLFGLLAGVASLVPVVGIKLVWVPLAVALAVVSVTGDPTTLWFVALFVVVSVIVVDWIPDQLLRPFVSGRNVHIGAIMLAYILGPLLFGWYGIFLGPLVLVVVFEFARTVAPWLADPTWTPGTTVASPPPDDVAGEVDADPGPELSETPDASDDSVGVDPASES
jgi:predicted PurR-regulated permease PerM